MPDRPAIEPLMRLVDEPKFYAISVQLISSAVLSVLRFPKKQGDFNLKIWAFDFACLQVFFTTQN